MAVSKSSLYEIRVETTFEAAHYLHSYKGKPEPIHGHSWKVEVILKSSLNKEGYGVDFVELKRKLDRLAAPFNHRNINEISPFDDVTPSAENLASWFFDHIFDFVTQRGAILSKVVVWEGPESSAACLAE